MIDLNNHHRSLKSNHILKIIVIKDRGVDLDQMKTTDKDKTENKVKIYSVGNNIVS